MKRIRSCGTSRTDGRVTHGKCGTKEYRIWLGMRQRCNNSNQPGYKKYGARGIKICAAWSDFSKFYSDMGQCPQGMTIERNNNNGPYSKANCSWKSMADQARNRRNNRYITIGKATKTLAEWARKIGIEHEALRFRIENWPKYKWLSPRSSRVSGERHFRSKLHWEQVVAIRSLPKPVNYYGTAKLYGVSPATIRGIVKMEHFLEP